MQIQSSLVSIEHLYDTLSYSIIQERLEFKTQELNLSNILTQRVDFLKYTFKTYKKITICDYEVKQQKKVATIETINYLESKYTLDKIYLVIGADNLKDIEKWTQFELLKLKVSFVVVTRSGFEVKNDIIQFNTIFLSLNISSTKLRENLDINFIPKQIQQKVQNIWKKELMQ